MAADPRSDRLGTVPTPAERNHTQPVNLAPLPDRDRLGAPLPTPLTSFVGREGEVEQVGDLLRSPDARLITLTGPGGVGKTRLAPRRRRRQARAAFPDGVGFVPLAAIADPALVPPTVARAIEDPEAGDRSPLQRLTGVLRSRRVLLVLDNFEHVVEAAPLVADLLAACPGLTVLVTSRVPLRVSGEHEFPVPPLPVPDLGHLPPVAELAGYGAVALFAQRARAVRPDFAIREGNAAAVAEVCARLDGLPLAIELAAARSKVLSPQAILARLEHRLTLLTGGSRDHPRAPAGDAATAIAWSYELLTPHQRALFLRLSVFAGGCTAGGGGGRRRWGTDAPGPATLDGLSSWWTAACWCSASSRTASRVSRCWRRSASSGSNSWRQAAKRTVIRRRHAAWCLELAEDADAAFKVQPGNVRTSQRLESEHDNLRAALAWLDETGDGAALLRLSGALAWFWYFRGYFREGLAWLERALARGRRRRRAADRAAALLGAGLLAHHGGDDARAVPWLEESLALFRTLADDWRTRYALGVLGIVDEDAGDYARATERLTEALVQARATDDPLAIGQALFHLGVVTWGRGDRDRAAALLGEALAVQRTAGDDPYGTADALAYLGLIACEQGDVARSVALQRESLSLHLELGLPEDIAVNLAGLAMLADASGQPARRRASSRRRRRCARKSATRSSCRNARSSIGDRRRARGPRRRGVRGGPDGRERVVAGAGHRGGAGRRPGGEPGAAAGTGPERGAAAAAGLSPRELEVLALLVAGGTNQEIADALFLSPRTVQAHLANLFAKLGVHTRAAAVARAYELGLV